MLGEPSLRLREAIVSGNLLIVKRLLRRFPGLLDNIDPANGWSSLHYASYHGRYLICVYLIQLGHDKHEIMRTFKGNTCVHLALFNGHEQTTHLLLQYFPRFINEAGEHNWTPVHIACMNDYFRCLSLLIGVGANLTIKDINGETPLHICLEYGSTECLKLLLQEGYDSIDENARDVYDCRPVDVATTYEFSRLYEKLKKEIKVTDHPFPTRPNFAQFRTPILDSKGAFEDGPSPVLTMNAPDTVPKYTAGSSLSRLPTISASRKPSISIHMAGTITTPSSTSRKSSDSFRTSSAFLKGYSKEDQEDSKVGVEKEDGDDVDNDDDYDTEHFSLKSPRSCISQENTIKSDSKIGKTFSDDTMMNNKVILNNLNEEAQYKTRSSTSSSEKSNNISLADHSKVSSRPRVSLLNIPIYRVRNDDNNNNTNNNKYSKGNI